MTQSTRRKPRLRWQVVIPIALVILIIAGAIVAIRLRPYPPDQRALAALQSGNGITVTDTADLIAFTPTTPTDTGLIYYPGGLVDPRAYAVKMRGIAEQGYAVYIVKMPLNLAVLGVNRAADVITAHPEITNWAIGGHSLGGVMACNYVKNDAARRINALLFHASYCDTSASLADRSDLTVVSLYATNDTLSTPGEVAESRGLLPQSATLIEIVGSNHAQFGDYGAQSGDGQATVSPDEATSQIVKESTALLAQIND